MYVLWCADKSIFSQVLITLGLLYVTAAFAKVPDPPKKKVIAGEYQLTDGSGVAVVTDKGTIIGYLP